MPDFHHDHLLAPAALACCILFCGTGAKRLFHKIKYIVCAAKPREHPAREGEDSKHRTRSEAIVHSIMQPQHNFQGRPIEECVSPFHNEVVSYHGSGTPCGPWALLPSILI